MSIQSLSAQDYFSKLLQKGESAELARSINRVNDSTLIIQFINHHTNTFDYGWMLIDLNGDTLSTFMFDEPLLRSDGMNTLVMSGDTVFQLMKHRDSLHHIRVYATSLSGDSLLRRDYDWVRSDWLIVYPRILHRRQNGEWLIFGTVAKGASKYDVWAIHCEPDGTEIQRKVIITDFEKMVPGVPDVFYLYAHNMIENENGYIVSLRNLDHDLNSSSHIIFVDHELNLQKRIDNGWEGLGLDYNPIAFNQDSTGIYFSTSRILSWAEMQALGHDDWQDMQYFTMITGMLDLEGNLVWERIMQVPYGTHLNASSGKTVCNGDFVVCGQWWPDERLGLVARYNNQGDLLFCYGFPLHPDPLRRVNYLVDFVEDHTGALMIVGEVFASGPFSNKDIWLLRIPGHGCDPELMDCDIDSIVSSIRLLPDIDKSASGMTMYPNPIFAGQPIHLELSGVVTGIADLRWLDMQGKQVHHEKVEIFENAPSLQVPSHLGAGWYLVELRDREGRSVSAKVVVWEKF